MPGMRGVGNKRTICEVLREINDLAQNDTEQDIKIRKLLAEAFHMAKKMGHKLYEYNKKFDRGWWTKHSEYEKKLLNDLRANKLYKTEEDKENKEGEK